MASDARNELELVRNAGQCAVSVLEVSSWAKCDEEIIRRLISKGIVERDGGGKLPLKTSIQRILSHYRSQSAGHTENDDPTKLNTVREKALLSRAQRERIEQIMAVERGDLVPVELAEAVIGAMIDACKQKLLSIPTKLAPMMMLAESQMDAKAILTDGIREATDELSDPDAALDRIRARARLVAAARKGDDKETIREVQSPAESED